MKKLKNFLAKTYSANFYKTDTFYYGLPVWAAKPDNGGFELAIAENEEQAIESAKQYIKETVWAFNADFLARMTDFDKIIFENLQPLFEGANDAILSLVEKSCGLDAFASEAIWCDGLGHFLASYDGVERECGNYRIFRIN